MNDLKTGHFPPAKQLGLILHTVIILLLAGASAWGFINLTNAQVGPAFVSLLLIGLIAFAPIPFLGYRAYALFKADYYIDRDSLAILWGLRVEDIPLTDIEWVRPASDLTHPLALPRLRLPGAVLGTRRHPDLGAVEFIASSARNLILIATSKHVFAISPKNAASLVRTFARATELGSLTHTEAKSIYPSFIITQAWESPIARFLWLAGLLLNLGLVAWVGMLIPALSQVPFGFNPFGAPNVSVPSVRLILLPLISALMFVIGLLAGLYFYRWEKERPLAFILWVSSTLCAVLFLLAVLFLVTTPV
ncbi:MAG TPA: PH domain-containing protein [Anaerolineales bacterium]|nr:PH domain-containing protein [Anaerolineales bacterium]